MAALSNIYIELWINYRNAVRSENIKKIVIYKKEIDKLMDLYSIEKNFVFLFKLLLRDRGLNISTKTLFPFDSISNEKYKKAKEIEKCVKKED